MPIVQRPLRLRLLALSITLLSDGIFELHAAYDHRKPPWLVAERRIWRFERCAFHADPDGELTFALVYRLTHLTSLETSWIAVA